MFNLPKQMKEIRLDKIGFNILADTDNMCDAVLLKNWQLQQKKGRQIESVLCCMDGSSAHEGGTV